MSEAIEITNSSSIEEIQHKIDGTDGRPEGGRRLSIEETHLGVHIVAEFFDSDFDALNDADKIEQAMVDAAKAAGATVLSSHKHFFSPHGVSSVVIIQESNLCIHTWPEFGYAAADFFTCGNTVNPWKSFEFLKTYLKCKRFNTMELQRGSLALIKNPELLNNSVTHPSVKDVNIITEYEDNADTATVIGVEEVYVSKMSKFQKVTIAKNKWWGNVLYLDNVLNVSTRDEFVYHEMIVHVPMMIHSNPTRVLIIGGGDGGSARELLKHKNLEKVVMIDIDEVVVNESRKYLPSLSDGAFDDPRLELIIGDGIDYVNKAADESFDVIIVDSTDPIPDSCGEVLFTTEFYNQAKRVLSANGVITTQSIMPMRYDKEIYQRSISTLQNSFTKEKTWLYLIPTDSYNGQTSLGLCFKGESHPDRLDKEKVKAFMADNGSLRYYNYKVHKASMCLPQYIKDYIGIPTEE